MFTHLLIAVVGLYYLFNLKKIVFEKLQISIYKNNIFKNIQRPQLIDTKYFLDSTYQAQQILNVVNSNFIFIV